MFYLSKGSLYSLTAPSEKNQRSINTLLEHKPILLIRKIIHHFSNNGREYTVCVLFDGRNQAFGAVKKNKINETISYNASDVEFIEGTLIHLQEYIVINSKNEDLCSVSGCFKNLIESQDRNKVVMVILEKFIVIGHDESVEQEKAELEERDTTKVLRITQNIVEDEIQGNSPDKLHDHPLEQFNQTLESANLSYELENSRVCAEDNSNDENDEYLDYKISDLKNAISRSKWSLRACVSNVTTVRQFTNQTNGSNGKTMRVQLYDDTGYIELVFFNNFCDTFAKKIKINKIYRIQNADIKISKKTLKAWPDKKNSDYDLYVNISTIIKVDSNQEIIEKTFLNKTQENEENLVNRRSGFIELNLLPLKKTGSLIKTTAFVCRIGEIYMQPRNGKSNLAIRRIEIIDDTVEEPVKMALWGNQAIDCKFILGHVYLIIDAELSDYGGQSLSYLKKSGFLDVTSFYNVPGVEKLTIWWKKVKSNWIREENVDKTNK